MGHHRIYADLLNNLAQLFYAQGRFGEAEPLLRRDLAILEKALGPDHPQVAKSINDLANLYLSQNRYDEAEPLLKRSLAIRNCIAAKVATAKQSRSICAPW